MTIDRSETISPAGIEHLRWAMTAEVGPVTFGRLVERFGSAQAALGASVQQLEAIKGIGRLTAEQMARSRDGVDVEAEVHLAAEHGVRIICQDDEEYPQALRYIPDPPICLYVRGNFEPPDTLAVAIVGARRCSLYGREQAKRLGYQLGSRSVAVVSGLARGVDSEAHKGALEAGGRTIAVLGNGLSSVYPPEHRDLARHVSEHGALVSELPMTTPPDANNFKPRNRLIAGLSLGVVVVEAAMRSGSLSTARLASEYDREVFAVPGRADSQLSMGTNALIRDQHAKLVLSADDILDELGEAGELLRNQPPAREGGDGEDVQPGLWQGLSPDEQTVHQALGKEEQSIERLADVTRCPPARVASSLLTLQLKGLARQLPGNVFVRTGSSA